MITCSSKKKEIPPFFFYRQKGRRVGTSAQSLWLDFNKGLDGFMAPNNIYI